MVATRCRLVETFEAVLVSGPRGAVPVNVRLERGEVFIVDPAGAGNARIPLSRITRLDVDASPQTTARSGRRTRFYGGHTVEIACADQPPVRIRAVGGGDIFTAFNAIRGDEGAQLKLVSPLHGYRQFVVELAGLLREKRVPIAVGKRGLVGGAPTAIAIGLAGAALSGWLVTQPYRSLFIGLYAIGPIMIFSAISMVLRTPGARAREVDGSEASLDAYLPKVV